MKKIFLLFVFSCTIILSAFGQCPSSPLVLTMSSTNLICNGDNSGTATVNASGGTGPYTYLWYPSGQTTSTATGLGAGQPSVDVFDALGNYCNDDISITEPAVLNATIALAPPPQISCFGLCDGTATATPSGGTGAYTYSWNTTPIQTTPTATGLCAGSNSVTITDANGCVRLKTFFITQPFPLAANGSSTDVNCFGNCNGTATVAPSGGNIPYTYSWSPGGAITPGISNLCVNTYTSYITDNKGCTTNYTTTITSPPEITVTVTGNNLVCNGVCTGSVSAAVGGGTGAYTYSWAPGGYTGASVTGLCANAYTLTVTDANGCPKTATITLTQPSALTSIPTGTNINCFNQCDGTVNANAGGGTGAYTYLWSPGGCTTDACSNLCDGTYSVTITDANGCTVESNLTLTEPGVLAITPSKTDESCTGSCDGTVTATVSGGTAPFTYAWSPGGCTTSACASLCVGTYSVTVTDFEGCSVSSSITINPPSPIIPNLSSTPATCFASCDGSVTSSTTGGVPPYTYSWSNGCVTSACVNLCAGNYSVTITDAGGCTATGSISISQPALFTALISSASPNPLNCSGDCNGAVLSTLNGGTATYTYLWTNGATTASLTGLCAGGYTLNATDANGCTASTSVIFTEPIALTATLTPTNPTCSGGCNGSITTASGGGTGAYTYSWLPGGQTTASITGLCAGNYSLTVFDNSGCSTTQTTTLTDPTPVSANPSVVNNVSCSGGNDGSATANPTGGTGLYTYLWTGGATTQTVTGLSAGSYNVLVQDANGCFSPGSVTISQPAVLFSIISSATSSCNLCNGSASVNTVGGTAPYTYLWSPGGQTAASATGMCVGNYTATITDANGCMNSVTVAITSQINVVMSSSGPSVSCPGSCDGSATATPSGGGSPYTYSWTTAPVQTTQTATGLCAGSYSVTLTDVTGCTSTNTVSFAAPAVLTAAMSSTSASCGICNGTATAAGAGGTGALTYSWSGFPVQTTATATGLCPADYTVTVTDVNNCTTTNTVTVGDVPTITNSASITLATCGVNNDGAICVTPAGGVPGYTYLWAPGSGTDACITGLGAGIYTVTISDAAGCSDDFLIGLGNTGGPTVTVTFATDPTCNAGCDGSIDVSAAGNSPFTYLWNNGQTTTTASALCAGSYVAQVSDNVPCITTSPTIILADPPQISVTPVVTDVSCSGGNDGNICLSPSGGASPYTFTWSGGQTTSCATGLTAGTYTVVVADANACDDTLLIPVSEPSLLNVSISSTDALCNGDNNGTATATVTGGTTLYTYAWSTGATLPTVVGLSPGNYSVTVTDNNGCTATATVAITEPAVLIPTVASTNISCNSLCDGTATISPSGGTTAYTYSWLPGGQTSSAITALCLGSYAATVTDANGCSATQTVSITEPSAISATVTATDASCFGGCNGSASASVNGGTGAYTYSWSPGGQTTSSATGLCAGSYTLTTSDANGCSTNNIFSISAPTVLQAGITSTPTSCTSTCNGTATSSAIGGTGAYTYQWSDGQTTATATGLCASTYTLIVSDANGCTIAQTTTISSPSALTQASAVAGATCLVCNGSISVVGSGGTPPYSFFWSTGATTATVTGLCAGLYIDTVMDASGCISVDTIAVSNTTGPVITLGSTNITCFGACDGTATVATVTGNDGPPWTYLWTPGSQTTQSITGLCPNQYFAQVTDTLGCITFDDVTITEPTQFNLGTIVTNATCFGICDGSITTSATGGTGAYTYSWLPGGETTTSITAQCAGNYTLTLTDASNCTLTTTITIGQNTILTPTLTSTNNTCNASCDGTASISISGGTAPYTYAWSPGTQTTSAVTGLCAGNYTVNVNDAIGCLSINTVTITEPGVLLANVAGIDPLCNGSCNGSITSTPSGGTPPYTYVWNPGLFTTSAVTGLCGSGSYTLTLIDANNCSATNSVTITDPLLFSLGSVITDASCTNTCDGSINISPAGGTVPYTFAWSPGGQTTEDITGLCGGNYTVTITDANACANTYTMAVGITTIVISDAGNDTSFCVGGTATLTSASTNATSLGWYLLPAWTPVGVTPSVSVSPAVGNTSYALIAMNGICSDTDTVVVTVNNYPVVIANNTTICSGSSASICASGANSYQWYQLPAWTPIAAGTCINVTPSVGITNYAVIGMNGVCSDTDSVAVTVIVMPVANAGADTAYCQGGSITLCGDLSTNALTFNWFELPLWTPRDTDTCTTVSPLVTSDYALIVSNGLCSDTDTVAVTIYPAPLVDAGADVTIFTSTSTVLNGTGTGSYAWLPATGLNNDTISNPTATPTATTTYTLVVTDASGCTATDTVTVTLITDIIPNDGLSPNGDGINDVWVIPGIEAFPDALVEVYNRWGELLFRSIGYSDKWDATYKGKELPVGTYYFVINPNSDLRPDPITGPITILR